MYNELIDALRYCKTTRKYGECENCPIHRYDGCIDLMHDNAADAIERLTAEVDRKDKALRFRTGRLRGMSYDR